MDASKAFTPPPSQEGPDIMPQTWEEAMVEDLIKGLPEGSCVIEVERLVNTPAPAVATIRIEVAKRT